MKKTTKFYSIVTFALMGIMMAGCSKDNDIIDTPQQPEKKDHVVTLTTTISMDGGAQTRALNAEGVKTFAVGETMAVIYTNTSGTIRKAVSDALIDDNIASGGKSAKFTFELTNPDKTKDVTYIYPASMAKDDGEVNYAALNSQDGTLTTIASSLDLATKTAAWNGTDLPSATLENQLAILEIKLKNSDDNSEITSDITGMTVSDGTNSYTVNRSAAAGPIYVAIRPTSSASIALTANDGTSYYTKSLTGKTYEVNNIYPVNWKMEKAYPFTIAGGNKVAFAPGNLQATYNGSTWNWHFAANQWDFIGNAEGNTKVSGTSPFVSEYSGTSTTVDLFGWVGASSTWDGVNMYGITSSTAISAQNGYGDTASEDLKADWGNNIGTGWRTLTQDEWTYLLETRSTTSTIRYAKAKVNDVQGVIILPDDWETSYHSLTSTNSATAAYSTNTVTSESWASDFEAHGAVFLPAAGYRSLVSGMSIVDAGSEGRYWSSSPYTGTAASACDLYFHSGGLSTDGNIYRSTGCSVRLVRNL